MAPPTLSAGLCGSLTGTPCTGWTPVIFHPGSTTRPSRSATECPRSGTTSAITRIGPILIVVPNKTVLADFLEGLRGDPDLQEITSYYHYLAPQPADYHGPEVELPPDLWAALERLGIARLYRHQLEALAALQAGKQILVATPTASGKTLIYNLPVTATLLQDPTAHALYLFPLKALEQDQLKALEELAAALPYPAFSAAIYDGDTPIEMRKRLRARPPQILISNPDMLHMGLLPNHQAWPDFFARLKFVVIDEVHTYKGIMGSHVAQVLRRLRRVCQYHGASPQFILSSATIANPEDLARLLIGQEVTIIAANGAPQAGRHFLFLNPTLSAAQTTARLFIQALRHGLATICFTQARKLTELLHLWALRLAPELKRRISSYRAGFLPEERREIEQQLVSGRMLGVISTSALEMGIDIGGLDVCLLVGYPGTMVTTWQRSGRVGRLGQDSLVVMVAQPDALDQYFIKHPEEFFSRPLEAAVLDPNNPVVVKAHLLAAAQEVPLELNQEQAFAPDRVRGLIAELERENQLLRSAAGETWYARHRFPQKQINIRGVGESFAIFKVGSRKAIGTIDGHRALKECHPGAVYLHKANSYLVENLDLERRNIWVNRVEPSYFTRIQTDKETEILEVTASRRLAHFMVRTGHLKVTERILAYEKRRLHGQELLSIISLELPPQIFETVGMWFEIEDFIKAAIYQQGLHFMGGIHALEHALISMFPLFALADRNDIGGISHPFHPQVGKAAVFIYDGYPGGVGLASRAYEMAEPLLSKTKELIAECPCEEGCPSCIHSPKCGSGNKPLDKVAALQIAEFMLGLRALPALKPSLTQVAEARAPALRVTSTDSWPWETPHGIGFLDLETQFSAEEVGGWSRCHNMKVSVAVLGVSQQEDCEIYLEPDIDKLCLRLQELDLVVGFNLKRFDYQVLQPYTTVDLATIPTFDILEDVHQILGIRLSLGHLAEKTLGQAKSGDGFLALKLFKEGRLSELIAYCQQDVRLTRALFEFGVRHGHLIYQHRQGALVRFPVDWTKARFFPSSS
ncbi:MAG: DEAD/DEAH box helicase [Deltaproteobacteria bacterium]|nr:DEAD/DEAH box helicase [Deltaproteobacteria bacterium]MBW1986206.1 DEAD/DEAH box helicase [Deltaproteobacteria bacterium]MBW2134103.1 DEAD/DEAH box helicase [Deltaproteobacteria bacterium]